MKKILFPAALLFLFFACQAPRPDLEKERVQIAATLDSFNRAAARADFEGYFNFYTENATFIGTDATEIWAIDSFKRWSKPYFDRGRAWNFTAIDRNIYFDESGRLAWFDELLNTQMKICRGSGVLVKRGADWKVQQYVLSMTVPNPVSDSVTAIKAALEQPIIDSLMR